MEHILNKIKEFDTILIHGHLRPDGDCIGSQYGLMHIINENFPGKKVIVTGTASDSIAFVGKPELVDESIFNNALCICVDCATKDRLSDPRIDKAKYTIKIDHHPNVDEYCDYQYVDTTASACAQIIVEIAKKLNLKINKEAAIALYVGIYTDTGRFKFDSVNSRTFMAAATLVELGVSLSYIDNNLSIDTLDSLKLKGYCLSNFKITENGFAYLIMKRETINEYGVSDEDAAAQVTTISTIEGCPAWAMFIEYPNEIRIRLRSRGPIINKLAEEYNGGGHPKASGANLPSWDDMDEFLAKADEVVKNYKLEEKL